MKRVLLSVSLAVSLLFLVGELMPSLKVGLVRNAEAIIGMPWTPMSVAGVARRSMYREAVYTSAAVNVAAANAAAANMAAANAAAAQAAAANAAAAQAAAAQASAAAAAAHAAQTGLPVGSIVPNLPPGCNSIVANGINYFNCNGTYYRAAFQGNNLVYVVSVP
jgi:hypothetical protein